MFALAHWLRRDPLPNLCPLRFDTLGLHFYAVAPKNSVPALSAQRGTLDQLRPDIRKQ